jgi:hypothetical protein
MKGLTVQLRKVAARWVPALARERGRGTLMSLEHVAQVFHSFADADRADEEYYASLTPQERVDILLELIERYRSSFGQAADRFERVSRVTELAEG